MRKSKGQALLLIVLVMVVVFTVGLALISRTITSLRTSTDQANSQKAFSAAEAGVEYSLKSQTGTVGTAGVSLTNSANYLTTVIPLGGTSSNSTFLLNGGQEVQTGDGADIWLSDYNTTAGTQTYANPRSGTLTIYWGDSTLDSCSQASLEIVWISGSVASPVLHRQTYDPCSDRRTANNFGTPSSGPFNLILPLSQPQVKFADNVAVTVSNGLIMRIIPVYKDTEIGISSTVTLPAQGTVISSTGTSGGASRKIQVYQGYSRIPLELFPYSIFLPN